MILKDLDADPLTTRGTSDKLELSTKGQGTGLFPTPDRETDMATITAAEFATELGTDSKTARRFLRTAFERDAQPGKGRQWAIEKRDLRSLKSKFNKWAAAEAEKKATRVAAEAEKKGLKVIVGDLADMPHVAADSPASEEEDKYEDADFDEIVAEVEQGIDYDSPAGNAVMD